MISQTIETLTQHFVTNWTNDVPVVFANQPNASPPVDSAWCRFAVIVGDSRNHSGSASGGRLLRQGNVWLQIFTPLQTGIGEAYDIAEDFTAIFRNARFDNLFLNTESIRQVPDEDWFMITVIISFDSFEPN